ALRTAYRQRAAEQHPDQALGNAAAFADLNTAYQTLSDPAARIRHLLARTPGASQASGQPPVDLGDLFMKIGGETRALDQLAARIRAASSALARAALAGERAGRLQAADQLLAELAQKEAAAIEELRRLDALWPSAEIHQPLGAIQARFAFL